MNKQNYSRRDLLKLCGVTAGASALPATRIIAAATASDAEKPVFRFAIASDFHFGQEETAYRENIPLLVSMLNREKVDRGLDVVFFNGDLVHDLATAYEALKANYLSKLKTPYYAIKGNHDYLDGKKASPGESWERIWGYPRNHVVSMNRLTFVLADTSAARRASDYRPADIAWLRDQLDAHQDEEAIFVFLHIAQRKQGVQGWPRFGVGRNDNERAKAGEAVMALIESSKNVRAIFHGHDHNSLGRLVSGGKPYFFDSHIGGSFGNRIGYRIVEMHTDRSMVTYQYDMQDAVIVNKHAL